jgi:hypothetical protein
MTTRTFRLLALAVAAVAAPSFAGTDMGLSPDPWRFPAEAVEGLDFVREGLRAQSIMAADFDADGRMDQAMIVRNTEQRVLLVLMAKKGGGFRRIGIGALDPHPLGETALSAPKGVLVVEDLTGGTTAIQSTYRFRYEKKTDRMRLIGDDVSLYSRTNQHGMTTISTNRLTGKRITTVNEVAGENDPADAALGPDQVTTTKVAVEPFLYLEDAPAPEATLGLDAE